jgi:hypothetical protein
LIALLAAKTPDVVLWQDYLRSFDKLIAAAGSSVGSQAV